MSRKTTTPFVGFLVWLGVVLLVAGCSSKQMSSSVQDQTLTPGPEPVAEVPVPQPSPEPSVQEAELPVTKPVPEVVPQPEPVPEMVPEPEPVATLVPEPPAEVPVEEPIAQSTEEERFTPQPIPLEEEIEPLPIPLAEVEEVVSEPEMVAEIVQEPDIAPAPEPAPMVVEEPAPVPPPSPVLPPLALSDVYFDFDRSALRTDAMNTLEAIAQQLLGQKGWALTIEGHCDERGTGAYNMVLGERRAVAVKRYLEDLGVTGGNFKIVSYGKEKPFCQEQSDDCYQLNRRAHFVIN